MTSNNNNMCILAVNGTLMRGLGLHQNMLNVGAIFEKETKTAKQYRLWSIDDQHPAMLRVLPNIGEEIAIETYFVPHEGLAKILLSEPPGLCIGKVKLISGEEVLGVLGEPLLCEGRLDITEYGGWRKYMDSKSKSAAPRPESSSTSMPVSTGTSSITFNLDSAPVTKQKTKKSKKSKKAPGQPKRNMSAYLFFAQEMRPVLQSNSEPMKFLEIGKKLGEMWQKLPESQRQLYVDRAAADKERYEREKAEWYARGREEPQ